MKLLLSILLSITLSITYGQEATIQSTALWSSADNLPFWMTHNQLGRYAATGNAQSLTEALVAGSVHGSKNLTLSYGADLALLATNNKVDPKIIEAWMGLSGKTIQLQAGAFAEPEQMGGLSSSNGDLLRSRNFRPYPRVQLATTGFIPVLVARHWLRVKAEYDEGILTGTRMDHHPHLHHKALMLRALASPSLRLTLGINHYAFWGGRSDYYGPLPDQPADYLAYVTGRAGNAGFNETDQNNVAGNQLGDYLLSVEKDFTAFQLRLQATHPFEDGSGMGFDNRKDNLYTLYLAKNQQGSLLDELVFEYMYTKNQSGNRALEANLPPNKRRGNDNYFNHGIYQSGFTHLGQSMGTPLFEPLQTNDQGIVTGVANNRVSAFHLGAKGRLSQAFSWKALLTYTRNFGTWHDPFSPMRSQLYSLVQLGYQCKHWPVQLNALLAVDSGELLPDNIGVGGQVIWRIR